MTKRQKDNSARFRAKSRKEKTVWTINNIITPILRRKTALRGRACRLQGEIPRKTHSRGQTARKIRIQPGRIPTVRPKHHPLAGRILTGKMRMGNRLTPRPTHRRARRMGNRLTVSARPTGNPPISVRLTVRPRRLTRIS